MRKLIFEKKFYLIAFTLFNLAILNSLYISKYFFLLGLAVFVLNIVPLVNFYYNYKKINYIPLFYFTHIFFFSCYTLALFIPELVNSIFKNEFFRTEYSNQEHENLFIFATKIYILGLFFFNLGDYIVSKSFNFKKKNYNFFDINDNVNELLILGLLSYIFCSVFFFKDYFVILNKVYQIKYPLIYLSILSIQLYIILKKDLKIILKFILYLLILLIIYIELLDGSVAKSFLYLIALYLINFIVSKKINLKVMISIIFVSIFIHTFKYEYRNVIWGEKNLNSTLKNYEFAKKQNNKKQNILDRSNYFIKTYKDSLMNFDFKMGDPKHNKLSKGKSFLKRNFTRLTHSFQSLLIVTALSPDKITYWEGSSYKILLTKFVPRIFWANKPSDTLGNEFGLRYKVLSEKDNHTSWNMPVLNEFYVNFGLLGTIFGMLFLGAFFKTVTVLLNFDYKNYFFLISFITLYPLFYLESHLSLTFGAVLQTFIFLYIYIFIFKKILLIMKRSL